jgi:hypothetical protein
VAAELNLLEKSRSGPAFLVSKPNSSALQELNGRASVPLDFESHRLNPARSVKSRMIHMRDKNTQRLWCLLSNETKVLGLAAGANQDVARRISEKGNAICDKFSGQNMNDMSLSKRSRRLRKDIKQEGFV